MGERELRAELDALREEVRALTRRLAAAEERERQREVALTLALTPHPTTLPLPLPEVADRARQRGHLRLANSLTGLGLIHENMLGEVIPELRKRPPRAPGSEASTALEARGGHHLPRVTENAREASRCRLAGPAPQAHPAAIQGRTREPRRPRRPASRSTSRHARKAHGS